MFPNTFALDIANDFITQISSTCDRIEIVGSLRRQKIGVNDIDLLVIPRFIQMEDETLFGGPFQENQLDKQLSQLCLSRDLELDANGSKIKRFLKTVDGDTVPIDLYIATEQDLVDSDAHPNRQPSAQHQARSPSNGASNAPES